MKSRIRKPRTTISYSVPSAIIGKPDTSSQPSKKFLFGVTLLRLDGKGIKHFSSGTEYTTFLCRERGYVFTAYVVDGISYEQI